MGPENLRLRLIALEKLTVSAMTSITDLVASKKDLVFSVITHSHLISRFVWLVPEYTKKIEDAVTGFDVFIGEADARPDLAKGAGGAFRYLVPVKNPRVTTKITEVALMRRTSGGGPSPGFVGSTSDLNRSRRGDFLYVIWKSVEVF